MKKWDEGRQNRSTSFYRWVTLLNGMSHLMMSFRSIRSSTCSKQVCGFGVKRLTSTTSIQFNRSFVRRSSEFYPISSSNEKQTALCLESHGLCVDFNATLKSATVFLARSMSQLDQQWLKHRSDLPPWLLINHSEYRSIYCLKCISPLVA